MVAELHVGEVEHAHEGGVHAAVGVGPVCPVTADRIKLTQSPSYVSIVIIVTTLSPPALS